MIIRCPQCQYANKVEAEAAKPRIVCSRCATVVSIEFLSNYELPASRVSEAPLSQTPLDMNKQETSPLDLDSLLEADGHIVAPAPIAAPAPLIEEFSDLVASPVAAPPVIAARAEEEEILDIPRAGQNSIPDSAQTFGMGARVEELLDSGSDKISGVGESVTGFAGTAVDNVSDVTGAVYNKAADTLGNVGGNVKDKLGAAGDLIGSFNPFGKAAEVVSSARDSVGDFATDAKDFVTDKTEEVSSAAFGQDSYNFKNPVSNTFVMATPDSNTRGLLTKVMLGLAALCALLAVGWFALSGSIKELFFPKAPEPAVATAPPPPVKPIAPGTVPSLGAKPGAVPAGSVAPGTSPAVTASASVPAAITASKPGAEVKPSVVAPAVPSVVPKAAVPAPATPAPAPANSGHAVGAGNGSLTVQVGAFKSEAEANSRIAKLKSSGVDARVVKAEVPGKGLWFRVQAGRFTNEGEANKYGSELKAKGSARDFIVTGYQGQ
jgi:cell division septation protein DedD